MKPILTITLMFISTILCAQTIDWQNAPLNPAAIYYTLNHYNLNGPIKEVNSISIEKRIFNLTFNEDGYLLKKLVSQPAETSKVLYEFEYQDKGILKSTKMSYVDSDNKITMTYEYLIFYNEKGLVSEKVALPNKSKTLYNYDEKGKLISLRYIN